MPRTTKSWLMDTGLVDVNIPISMASAFQPTTGAGATTFSYSDSFGLGVAPSTAATTYNFYLPVNALTLRSGLQDDLQEAFGGGGVNPTTGVAAPIAGAQGLPLFYPPISTTSPAQPPGAPPFTGMSQFNPPMPKPKGIKINALTFLYQLTAAVTTNNVGLTWHQFPNTSPAAGLAPVNLLPLAQYGMQLGANAGGQMWSTLVPVPNPQWMTLFNNAATVKWSILQAGAPVLYQVILHCTFNYN